jgi:hypothetical protein
MARPSEFQHALRNKRIQGERVGTVPYVRGRARATSTHAVLVYGRARAGAVTMAAQ